LWIDLKRSRIIVITDNERIIEGKYYVGYDEVMPTKIYFNLASAKLGNDQFIMVFDEEGNHLGGYKRIGDHLYTTEFE